MVDDGPGTVDGVYALANRGSTNKNGTTENMAWAAMGQEEVKDQLNDSDKSDMSVIDIISLYWKSASRKLIVKVTGLHGLGGEAVNLTT